MCYTSIQFYFGKKKLARIKNFIFDIVHKEREKERNRALSLINYYIFFVRTVSIRTIFQKCCFNGKISSISYLFSKVFLVIRTLHIVLSQMVRQIVQKSRKRRNIEDCNQASDVAQMLSTIIDPAFILCSVLFIRGIEFL